jgi:hypothetical protein
VQPAETRPSDHEQTAEHNEENEAEVNDDDEVGE